MILKATAANVRYRTSPAGHLAQAANLQKKAGEIKLVKHDEAEDNALFPDSPLAVMSFLLGGGGKGDQGAGGIQKPTRSAARAW